MRIIGVGLTGVFAFCNVIYSQEALHEKPLPVSKKLTSLPPLPELAWL